MVLFDNGKLLNRKMFLKNEQLNGFIWFFVILEKKNSHNELIEWFENVWKKTSLLICRFVPRNSIYFQQLSNSFGSS